MSIHKNTETDIIRKLAEEAAFAIMAHTPVKVADFDSEYAVEQIMAAIIAGKATK